MFSSALHVGRPNIHDHEAFLRHARQILESRWLTNDGQYVRDLEAALAERLNVRNVVATCNATLGLQIALKALLGDAGGEVIVPAFTFVATAQAVSWLGLTPVFADVLPDTHCLDPDDVARRIGPDTRAILGVHLWGGGCDTDRLASLAKAHGLKLAFDAAHAFGTRVGDVPIGAFGDAEVFSFHATKVFNTFEGGAIATNDDDLARRLRLIRNFGFSGYDRVECLGVNGKMPEICAAMGLVNLDGVDGFIAENRDRHDIYKSLLAGVPGLRFLAFPQQVQSNCHYVVLEVDEAEAGLSRDALVSYLQSKDVLARRYFAPGLNHTPPYGAPDGPRDPTLPVSERLTQTVLVLPTGPSITPDDVRQVAGLIRAALAMAAPVQRRPAPIARPQPMVSVVLTTYRHEAYIEQAIRSAAEQQTNFPIEILVGEDGSPDGTRAVCERLAAEFPDRVRLFAHEQNMGGHDNFNFLWTRASGKYIAWLEGDDYWTDPMKLQIQVEAMERTPKASFCFHNSQVFQEGAPISEGFLLPGFAEERLLPFSHLVFVNRTMTCSALYRRGLVPELPPWVWPLKIGDWPMHLMHAVQGPALFLPQVMAAYRLHPTGGWTSRPLLERLQETIDALDAVRVNVPSSLEYLCVLSIDAIRREMDLVRSRDVLDERDAALASVVAEADALREALAQTQTVSFYQTISDAAAPPWRRAWRKVWRPVYRRFKGA